MVLVLVVTSCIGVSSMVVSFCGDMTGDCIATLFFAEDPVGLLEGVLMAGIGFGILPGVGWRKDTRVIVVEDGFLMAADRGLGVDEDAMLPVVCADGRRQRDSNGFGV